MSGNGVDMQEWLTTADRYEVERIACPHPGEPVDLAHPPAGVLHTVEGSWDGGMAVFRAHFAPHFLVGRDRLGRIRVAQLVPLGMLACALENRPGGGETNRWVRAQIEVVGYSQEAPWLPDPATLDALVALMQTLEQVAEIPFSRPFGVEMPTKPWTADDNSHRTSGIFGTKPGWYGHIDLPENAHWDPGYLQWDALFAHTPTPLEKQAAFIAWMRWHLSGRKTQRPGCLPAAIPQSWWSKLKELTAQV
jgi:hypothetical protein